MSLFNSLHSLKPIELHLVSPTSCSYLHIRNMWNTYSRVTGNSLVSGICLEKKHISTIYQLRDFWSFIHEGLKASWELTAFPIKPLSLLNHNKNISKSLGNNQDNYLHFNWNSLIPYKIVYFMKDRVQNGGRMLRDYPSSLIKGKLMCVVNNGCIESFIKYKKILVWNALNNIEVDITVSDKITSTYGKKGFFFFRKQKGIQTWLHRAPTYCFRMEIIGKILL